MYSSEAFVIAVLDKSSVSKVSGGIDFTIASVTLHPKRLSDLSPCAGNAKIISMVTTSLESVKLSIVTGNCVRATAPKFLQSLHRISSNQKWARTEYQVLAQIFWEVPKFLDL
jgi:hypothetical protein